MLATVPVRFLGDKPVVVQPRRSRTPGCGRGGGVLSSPPSRSETSDDEIPDDAPPLCLSPRGGAPRLFGSAAADAARMEPRREPSRRPRDGPLTQAGPHGTTPSTRVARGRRLGVNMLWESLLRRERARGCGTARVAETARSSPRTRVRMNRSGDKRRAGGRAKGKAGVTESVGGGSCVGRVRWG